MLEINNLLLLIAVITPVLILVKTWRKQGDAHTWRVAAIAVLLVAGGAWLLLRHRAGYIAGGAWFVLLFIPAVGLRRVADLASTQRFGAARRLAAALRIVHPSHELRHEVEVLRMYEKRPDLSSYPVRSYATDDLGRSGRVTPAVLVLVLLNIAAFLFEITQRDWQSRLVLHRLGALEPFGVLYRHEYWRLFTSLFLHYDVLHILFNLFALYVLAPPLERAIGTVRFTLCYLLSGLGSNLGVIWLSQLRLASADELVGASGCIMGIVGAWGAYLMLRRHMPLARQRLMNVATIVVIQFIFDVATPQISMSAHLCGLGTGFLIGLIITPRGSRLEA